MSRWFLSLLVLLCPIARASAADFIGYVTLGENGAALGRVVTDSARCPSVLYSGQEHPMTVRARAGTVARRPTKSAPEMFKASTFGMLTCEAPLPSAAIHATVDGQTLPTPPRIVNRIVVIGDTGCRIKGAETQACNDTAAFPFATVAARAAAWKPDLVLHVGVYLYRENPCPAAERGCHGSPWGYGWDAWDADFFTPALPLLHAAPWIFVRGNHENCDRAGQGWWRFLAPFPLTPGRDCDKAEDDALGDDSPTIAVPLGGGAQIVAMDLAYADEAKALDRNDPKTLPIAAAYQAVEALSAKATFTFLTTHKPILGFSAKEMNGQVALQPGNQSIQSVFATMNPGLLPAKVDVILSGHYHAWEQISFVSDHPSQFIAGFSGTQEDILPLPAALPPNALPAPGTRPDRFSSWVNGFGYMTLERRDAGGKLWDVKVWNVRGEVVNTCRIEGKHSACDKDQVH